MPLPPTLTLSNIRIRLIMRRLSHHFTLGLSFALIAFATPIFGQSPTATGPQNTSKDVASVLHQALLAAQEITEPRDRNFALQNIAALFVQAGDSQDARNIQKLLTDERAKDSVTYAFAYSAASSGKLSEALSIANRIPDEILRQQCFGAIAGLRAISGDLAGAREALNSIQDPFARASQLDFVLSVVADRSSKSDLDSLIAMAIKNANDFPDKDARFHWLLKIAIVQKKTGDSAGSLQNLRTVRDAIMNDEISRARLYFIASDLADALVDAGASADALPIADKMSNLGAKENALYRIACSQARAEDIPGVKNTLSWMATESNRVGALECLGMAQAKVNDFQGALESAERILREPHQTLGPGTKEGSYNLVLGEVVVDEAKRGLLNDALALARKLNIRSEVEALIAFGSSFGVDGHSGCNKNVLDNAYSVAIAKPESGNDQSGVSSLNDLAVAQTDCQYWPEAQKSASTINEDNERALTIQYLAYWQSQHGDWHEVSDWAAQVKGAYPRASAFIGIAQALMKTEPPFAHILSCAHGIRTQFEYS